MRGAGVPRPLPGGAGARQRVASNPTYAHSSRGPCDALLGIPRPCLPCSGADLTPTSTPGQPHAAHRPAVARRAGGADAQAHARPRVPGAHGGGGVRDRGGAGGHARRGVRVRRAAGGCQVSGIWGPGAGALVCQGRVRRSAPDPAPLLKVETPGPPIILERGFFDAGASSASPRARSGRPQAGPRLPPSTPAPAAPPA